MTPPPVDDLFPSTVHQLSTIASQVLNEHVNDAGLCAVCGSAFPCGRAVLAEHNLASL
ncbi:hypothetical protein [Carbonactinospora thermoautotrophica]|uniref:Uncharacterized protein n=1 Tax=Carbonactinospora thermoautotrophica TaxID=1469144 RepID=A0A132MX86_9ACTN|nr:hypothetical protein [Carbonactinospora thermoautotrophica]KWX02437.1 hypothetical protein LI90_3480 [Carbonactinospora thermoautotrophica]